MRCFALVVSLVFLLAACSDSSSTTAGQSAGELIAIDPGDAPAGRLDRSVVPLSYRLELRIDPSLATSWK